MANPRTSQGHTLVAVLIAATAVVHVALAAVPSARPGWVAAVSGLLTLVAAALLVAGLAAPRTRFGGDAEDAWLVACAATGAVGVALGLVVAYLSFSGGRNDVDLLSIGALLMDALTVRIAVFTLRRVPAPPARR